MKILHLSTHDTKGGGARSAYRLHSRMRARDVDSRMLVQSKWSQDPSVDAFVSRDAIFPRAIRRAVAEFARHQVERRRAKAAPGFDLFSTDRTGYRLDIPRDVDLVNLHWVAGFVDPLLFFCSHHGLPIVWRFSDTNPITGGCHYDAGCDRSLSGCGRCPQLASNRETDASRGIWARRKKAFDQVPEGGLHLVAQSRWMAEQMGRSPLVGRFPVTVIANGVDLDIYRPQPRPGLRSSLGLRDDECVVLFVATSTRTRRKGLPQLLDAIGRVGKRVRLISVGSSRPLGLSDDQHMWLGPISNDHMLAAIYNSADLFALPSLQDNLPNTAIEAMACGTPVVGFDAGGAPDIIDDGATGRLVPLGDTTAFAEAINALAADASARELMRGASRSRAESLFSLDRQVGRFLDLYRDILARQTSRLQN